MTFLFYPSPNSDSRDGQPVDMLVLHYTGMPSGDAALERLCDAEANVSAHYLIEEDGRIFQLVDESQRAWHAGVSGWRGHSNINARSVGIEIVNPGHEWGYRPFPPAQMQAVLGLCQAIIARHAIAPRNVVGHSDVAYLRKTDPGELFDWPMLAAQGVGLWPAGEGSAAPLNGQALCEALAAYGYDIAPEADTATLAACITAFQRHFRPSLLSGEWDAACQWRLDCLLAMV